MTQLKLFAWGANNYGQLANGQPCEQLERPLHLEGIELHPEAHLVPGGGHSLLLNGSKIYSAGWNNKGRDVRASVLHRTVALKHKPGLTRLILQSYFRGLAPTFVVAIAKVSAGLNRVTT